MCDYQGYEFGAGAYPDSICIDGRLHDADNSPAPGEVYLQEEDIPCPICRPADAIAWWSERNAFFIEDGESEAQCAERAAAAAVSLVNHIRANRGLSAAA